ncbi:MAG TPA: hypothetical protein VHX37_00015 [Acidobacteriaceae bacterium]|nr:hypothetical protein [Acidobacteriaceae bacterium]
MTDAKSQLRDWFRFLAQFRTCCASIDSEAAHLSGPDFANSKPIFFLPDAEHQNQFAICAANATGLPLTADSVCSASSFLALLESSFGFLNVYVAPYLQSLSPLSFNTMNGGDYILQKARAVFPAGAADGSWTAIDNGLAGIMSDCYSPAQRRKVAALVGDSTKVITDLVNQIAVPG